MCPSPCPEAVKIRQPLKLSADLYGEKLNFETSYFSFFTLGGLHTSTNGEVLDHNGKAIAGLFAAGRCTHGLPAWGHGYSSGLSLADCTFFGRRAGSAAAHG